VHRLLTILANVPFFLQAQIQIDFAADTNTFCPPYTVTFQDLSYGGTIVSRTWIFGQGGVAAGGTATPQATYIQAGSYDVTLIIFDGIRRDTLVKRNFIRVWQLPKPIVSILGSRTGCTPLGVQLDNNSLQGDAPIGIWNWNFGDGQRDTARSPAHIYQSPGKFTIHLTAIDTNGCQADTSLIQVVDVYPKPRAAFTTQGPSHACTGPLQVDFVNQSSGQGPLQFSWNFGDGNTSTAPNPSNTYYSGNFPVKLIVTDKNGCRDTADRAHFASVGSANASFSFPYGDTICLGDPAGLIVQNTSTGGASSSWDFGDGTPTVQSREPVHHYAAAGVYTVKLTVNSGQNCIASTTRQVRVIQPTGDFTFTPSYACEEKDVFYEARPMNGLKVKSYEWLFRFGGTYNTDTCTVRRGEFGQQIDTLYINYDIGKSCVVAIIKPTIRIWYPPINVTQDKKKGCIPLSVSFEDNHNAMDSIASWTWDFGDGTSDTGHKVTHIYTAEGIFYPTVTIRTKSGCVYIKGSEVRAGSKQNADFTVDSLVACASHFTKFPNLSTDSSKIDEYWWDYGDGGTGRSRLGINRYKDTGYFDIRLIVGYHGCYDTLIKPNYIYRKGPVLHSNLVLDCDKPFERYLDSTRWVDVQRFYTTWGDSTGIDSVSTRPRHTYANRGDYIMTIVAYNDSTGCDYFYQQEARIRHLQFDGRSNRFALCWRETFSVEIFNDLDLEMGTWYVVDSNATWTMAYNYVPSSSFENFMTKNTKKITFQPQRRRTQLHTKPELMEEKRKWAVNFIGADINGCLDTAYTSVKFYQPMAKFSLSHDTACAPAIVTAIDSSRGDTALSSWKYWLGDRNWVHTPNFTRKFIERGYYGIQLEVTDVLGCKRDTSLPMILLRPMPLVHVSDSQLCIDEPSVLTLLSKGYKEKVLWQWGTGQIDTNISAKVSFGQAGKQTAQLTVTDSLGCDTTVAINNLHVQKVPVPFIVANPRDTSCYPAEVMLTDTVTDTNVVLRYWQPDATTSIYASAGRFTHYVYTRPGNYGVKLILETNYGCRDSTYFPDAVRITGPYAQMAIPDTLCMEALDMFKVQQAANVLFYEWDFGDGMVDTMPGHQSVFHHKYAFGGTYPVTLILRDTSGACSKWLRDTLFVEDVSTQIVAADSIGCAPFAFTATASTSHSTHFDWIFDGLPPQSGNTYQKSISDTGTFLLKVKAVKPSTGCAAEDDLVIRVMPRPSLRGTDSRIVCYGDSIQLQVDGAMRYQWHPAVGLSSDTIAGPKAAPPEKTIYTITGTAGNGCTAEMEIYLDVVQPPYVNWPADTEIFLGQTYTIPIEGQYQVSYLWTPALYLSCNSCANPEAKPPKTMTYQLKVTDKFGCFEMDSSFTIHVSDEMIVLIPNAFSPNGDGLNDKFWFYTKGLKSMEQFDIFDRWGALVYSFKDFDDSWDGHVNGSLCPQPQTFVYKASFVTWTDEIVEYTGFIALIR
jgi:gliding motility-associated-like protein